MGQIPSSELNGFGKLAASLFFIFGPALYLLPTFEAWKREHKSLSAIALLNIFLGWTLIGWVAAMVWACKSQVQAVEIVPATPSTPAPAISAAPSLSDEMRKLAKLRDDGILSEDEFQAQKAKLLA